MHRTTTTTAALLVTLAFPALSGCVSVQRPPAPGPAVAPSRASVPRPDGAEPQVVQAPAREALAMVGPTPSPKPRPPAPAQRRGPAAVPAPAPHEQPPSSRSRPHTRPHTPPRHPEARRRAQPRVEIPDVAEEVRRSTDVCALGRKYGGWRGDSPEAVICGQAYGR